MELLDIINEQDEVIGQAPRNQVYEKNLLHRIVHIIIQNSEGKIALQRRSQHVGYCPGYWSTTVGGHVQSGESYEKAAIREYEEELGSGGTLTLHSKHHYTPDNAIHKYLVFFETVHNGPFSPNPREVDIVDFFTREEINDMRKRGEPFHPELIFFLDTYHL